MGVTLPQADHGLVTASLHPRLGTIAVKARGWAPTLLDALSGDISAVTSQLGINLPEWDPRQATMRGDGSYDVDLSFAGFLGESFAGEEFDLDGTTSDDPVETHINYPTLLSVYGGTEDAATGRGQWPKTTASGARNRMHGVESYLAAGLTWTHRYISRVIPAGVVTYLGVISQPPSSPTQAPPQLGGGRNWIKIRVRAKFIGNAWQIEETWLLSGPGGWVPEMYQFGAGLSGSEATGAAGGTFDFASADAYFTATFPGSG